MSLATKMIGKNGLSHMLISCVALLIFYALTVFVKPGWATYFMALPGALLIGFIAAGRANAIEKDQVGTPWTFRRAGLAMVAGACTFMVMWPLIGGTPITWRLVLLINGFAFVWTTTPGMPPLTDYVFGKVPLTGHPLSVAKGLHARVTGQFPVIDDAAAADKQL